MYILRDYIQKKRDSRDTRSESESFVFCQTRQIEVNNGLWGYKAHLKFVMAILETARSQAVAKWNDAYSNYISGDTDHLRHVCTVHAHMYIRALGKMHKKKFPTLSEMIHDIDFT